MIRNMLLTLCLIAAVNATVVQSDTGQPAAKAKPIWFDEFNGKGLPDSGKWAYDVGGHGWGNQELQYYTDKRRENARIENGRLIIEARKEAFKGKDYTSARLVTKGRGDWTYGRVEVRAKLPSGRGTWPAIWMLATKQSYSNDYWPDNGEIDIMEHVGFDPDIVHASTHTRAYHHSIGTQKTAKTRVAGARTGFHVYSMEWTPSKIRAFVDGKPYFDFPNERLWSKNADYRQWPFDRPFHLLLNVAVGGFWGGQKGIDDSIWPQRMEVDYVRVFANKVPTP